MAKSKKFERKKMISAVSEIGISRKKMLDIKEGFKVEGWRFLEPEQVLLKKKYG